MGTPFTQTYIQEQIDFYAAQMQTATQAQKYAYDEGPVGQFSVDKAKLEEIKKALEYWIGLMNKYFPDAFSVDPQIEFNEIGYLSG